MVKIVVDCYGGDDAPASMIEGAVLAVENDAELEIVLVGREDEIKTYLQNIYKGDRISVVHADEIIENEDTPTQAIKEKKNSSMVVALTMLAKEEGVDGIVSAGSTGALLTGAFMIVRRIKGISRPALCTIVPKMEKEGHVIFLDCGANSDCKPQHFVDFALMGNAYAKTVWGIKKPTVAILSNGSEEGKGNELTKAAYEEIKQGKLNFVGNVEARDVMRGDYDVVVTDGFTGNIALKSYEGMANNIFYLLKKYISEEGVKAKIGALFLKKALKKVKKSLDYTEIGGGIFLGVEKPVVKAHGASKAKTVALCIGQAKSMAENKVIDKIKGALPVAEN